MSAKEDVSFPSLMQCGR